MDSESTILALIVVLTCIMPILILKLRAVFKKHKLVRSLFRFAKDHNATIGQYDHWNNSAIGSNKNGTRLFTVNFNNGRPKNRAIILASYTKCNLINDNAGADFKEGSFKVTNGVDLELVHKTDAPERISFYNVERDGHLLTEELELAKKWCGVINEHIIQKAWLYEQGQE